MPAGMSLVILPGMDGTGRLFEPFVDNLPKTWTPIVVHYPTDRPLGYAELLPLVEAALPADGPFVLLAESFSGPLAVQLAAKRPPRLIAVILAGSFVRTPHARLSWVRYLARSWIFRLSFPAWGIRRWLVGDDASSELVAAVQGAVKSVAPAVMARRARDVLAVDVRSAIPGITVPLLVLTGSQDRVVPRSNVDDLRQLGDRFVEETLEAPHLLLHRQPALAARLIVKFVEATVSR